MSEIHLHAVDLNMLVALDALLSHNSVTQAAVAVGVSQSAMSHTLRKLREFFGDELLVRGAQGMVPTAKAEALRAPIRHALAQVSRALQGGASFDPASSQRSFRLGANDYASATLGPALLGLVEREAPLISLDMRPFKSREGVRLLESASIDAAITVELTNEWVGLEHHAIRRRQLYTERFVCVARCGHPQLEGGLDLQRYCAIPHLLISPSGQGNGVVDRALEGQGLKRRVALRTPNFLAATLMAAQSDYLLTLPRRMAELTAEAFGLQIYAPPIELPSYKVVLVWHERFHQEEANAWLRDVVARAAELADLGRFGARASSPKDAAPPARE